MSPITIRSSGHGFDDVIFGGEDHKTGGVQIPTNVLNDWRKH